MLYIIRIPPHTLELRPPDGRITFATITYESHDWVLTFHDAASHGEQPYPFQRIASAVAVSNIVYSTTGARFAALRDKVATAMASDLGCSATARTELREALATTPRGAIAQLALWYRLV
ncbi:hypothetical protein [Nocardia carnea]|uniref:hypothetical protein n=1 Tax=Nocardia carnea TaxID=37328 RepID=UPI0024584B54|nr:hypothetical protein [Nocardia carnea]